jgi:hypothetical protein
MYIEVYTTEILMPLMQVSGEDRLLDLTEIKDKHPTLS